MQLRDALRPRRGLEQRLVDGHDVRVAHAEELARLAGVLVGAARLERDVEEVRARAAEVRGEAERLDRRGHEGGVVEADPLLEPLVELVHRYAVDEHHAVHEARERGIVFFEARFEEAVVLADRFVLLSEWQRGISGTGGGLGWDG